MTKHCETFEHTADLGLEARADSPAELLEALGEGLYAQICQPRDIRLRQKRRVQVAAEGAASPRGHEPDAAALELLVADFLRELLRLFHLERFLVGRVRVERCDETAVAAEVAGESYDPARHELGLEIKAVTYHQLKVARDRSGWLARVILDI
jgi:SHS2 domain-containing protein